MNRALCLLVAVVCVSADARPKRRRPPPPPPPPPTAVEAPSSADAGTAEAAQQAPAPAPSAAVATPAVATPAKPASTSARVAVDFQAARGSAPWYAAGLEQMVAKEAGRFSRVSVVGAHTDGGVDVLITGTLDGDRLSYEVHETWTGTKAAAGTLAVGGSNVNSRRVQHQIAELVRPIVSSGGLLDKRPVETEAPDEPAPVTAAAQGDPRVLAAFLAGLALLLAWPPLLLALLLRRKRSGEPLTPSLSPTGERGLFSRAPRRAWAYSAFIAAALFGAGALLLARVDASFPPFVLPLLGGVLWGTLGVLHLQYVCPPISGLGRIRHDALGQTLRAWLTLCALRASALVLWLPLFTLTAFACKQAGLDSTTTLTIAVPCVGLWGCFFLASLGEHVSRWLDVRLVDGPPDTRNEWHATVRKYFMGYVRRGGLVLQRRFLEKALFLPGLPETGFEVVSYGGGLLGRPRIVVGAKAREAALGELPDDPEAPERTANMEELPLGFVIPSPESDGREARAEKLRKKAAKAADRPRAGSMPRLLGENATALGWVVPHPFDEAVPLISNTREDYEVVKSLLSEHYGRFEKNLDEDDHDDTDPTQKDFLFGPLMVAAGGFTRHDSLFGTLALALELGRPRASWPSRMVLRLFSALHARFLAWPRAVVADAFAALNLALHPLLQHLHLQRGGDAGVLTARADLPRLIDTSKTLLEGIATTAPAGDEVQLFKPGPRNRMLWLAPFFAARLAPPRARAMKLLAVAGAVLLVAAVAVDQVRTALEYRPVYVDRMTQMRAMADQATQGATTK